MIRMIFKNKKKIYFNITGIAIVSFWLLMIGVLVQRTHFGISRATPGADISMTGVASAQRDWREIYLKDSKVGYAVSLIKPFDDGYFIQEEMFLKLNLMGLGKGLYTMTQSRVDKGFFLKSFHFSMSSGTVRFRVKGRVEGNVLVVETGQKGQKRVQKVKLTRPPMMGASMGYFFRNRALRVGETFKLPLFDPSTMAQKEAFIRVAGRESVDIYGLRYDAYRLETELWGKNLTFWLDEKGDIIKETGFM